MAELWTFRIVEFDTRGGVAPDLAGFDVEAQDGHIGKVDEATYETGASCVVVDTGWWIFGKKRMIPAGVIERIDRDERKIHVGLSKDEIKDAPDYDAAQREVAAYRDQHSDYYGRTGARRG
ncbi:MAG TPA: hypothetical protein VFZ77_23645 [Acidimicrobiales bacterium]